MKQENFYHKLQGFHDFKAFNNSNYYCSIPPQWFVIISDVTNSTQLIEKGQYKDINTISATTISFLQNALTELAFPFIFGGNGYAMAVKKMKHQIKEKL